MIKTNVSLWSDIYKKESDYIKKNIENRYHTNFKHTFSIKD